MSNLSFLRIQSIVRLIVVLAVGMGLALSQSTFGTIVGTVHDSSGALMPGCVITVENVGTSFRRMTMADESAAYVFPNLEPGVYKVTIMAPGFQVAEYTKIQLLARQTVRIDGQMSVATQTETVSVVADAVAPVITTESLIAGPAHQPERDVSITAAHSFFVTPQIINELRVGLSDVRILTSRDISARDIIAKVGVPVPDASSGSATPTFSIIGNPHAGFLLDVPDTTGIVTEGVRLQVGAAASNVFNHPNYAIPNLNYGTALFGTITNGQTAEGSGPRQFQITSRVIF